MTSTTELNWQYLGTVNVDIGVLLIADEQHFRDLHKKWEDNYEEAENDYERVGYRPDTGGDGSWDIYGYEEEGVLQNILIEYAELQGTYEKFIDFKKEKIKSIKVHTGKIAINDPSAWYPHEMYGKEIENVNKIEVQNSFSCPLGNGDYDVYETEIVYKPFDSNEPQTSRFGVVINLNPNKEIETKHLLKRVDMGGIYKGTDIELNKTRNLILGRTEYFATGNWTAELFHQSLLNGFESSLSSIYNRNTEYYFACAPSIEKELESALETYSKDNLRKLDKETIENNFILFHLH